MRKIPFIVGEYYHLYNRGVDRRVIFADNHDYARFRVLLYLCNNSNSLNVRTLFNKDISFVDLFLTNRGEQLVDIGLYCFMPNHFHILVRERVEGGISVFMQKLGTSYSMYFNTKNNRKGSLFEGKFKAKHIDSDSYLNWIFSYIHLNPIKLIEQNWKEKGISDLVMVEKFIKNYKYSSWYDYFIGDRLEGAILNKEVFPDHFMQLKDFDSMVSKYNEEDYGS